MGVLTGPYSYVTKLSVQSSDINRIPRRKHAQATLKKVAAHPIRLAMGIIGRLF